MLLSPRTKEILYESYRITDVYFVSLRLLSAPEVRLSHCVTPSHFDQLVASFIKKHQRRFVQQCADKALTKSQYKQGSVD